MTRVEEENTRLMPVSGKQAVREALVSQVGYDNSTYCPLYRSYLSNRN